MRIYYDMVPSDIGKLAIGVSSWGVCGVVFAGEAHDTFGDDAIRDRGATRFVHEQIDEYFAGSRTNFELPIDWSQLTGFKGEVLKHMALVPYGETTTYGHLAHAVGKPGAARAVGGVCAHNPMMLVVPCHRVVNADGRLGGFRGGINAKAHLLAHEGIILPLED